jgi:glycerol-3-phosphate O-acyltransferase / dihydroxyacetone phosphate acyltransferase
VILYETLKPVMHLAVRIFYRVQVDGSHNVPLNRPVIVAPNHPNAFMDAIAIAVNCRRQLHFLVRSDVFNTPLKRWFLGELNQIPIYRIQEGADNLHKNEETFAKCNEILAQKKVVLIFPEGLCVQERRLRKLKKGLARIVFGAEASQDYNLGLVVVPIGLNYENPKKFRSRLLITYGEPIEVSDYVKQYLKEPARTVNEFTRDVEDAMGRLLTIIPDKKNDKLVEDIEEVYKQELIADKGLDPENLRHDMDVSNGISQAVEYFDKHQPGRTEAFREKIRGYLEELEASRLRDHLLRPKNIMAMSYGKAFIEFMGTWLGLPLHVYGLISNYLPWKLAYALANKATKNIEFHSSVNVAAGTFLFLVWWSILTLAVALGFRDWYLLGAYIISLPLGVWFNLMFWPFMKKVMGRWRLLGLVRKDHDKVAWLVNTRKEIMQEIEAAREEYRSAVKADKVSNG